MCLGYSCQWASTGCGPPVCGPSACEPLPLPRPCTGQLGCETLEKESHACRGCARCACSCRDCHATLTAECCLPTASCSLAVEPASVGKSYCSTPLEAQPQQQALRVRRHGHCITLLHHNQRCGNSGQQSQVRWPCTDKPANHVSMQVDLSFTALAVPRWPDKWQCACPEVGPACLGSLPCCLPSQALPCRRRGPGRCPLAAAPQSSGAHWAGCQKSQRPACAAP